MSAAILPFEVEIHLSSAQSVVYALWEEVPKLVYYHLICKPVFYALMQPACKHTGRTQQNLPGVFHMYPMISDGSPESVTRFD